MDSCRLGLAAVAALGLLIAVKPEPASAVARLGARAAFRSPSPASPLISAHFSKTQSYYCYPRNYWWFYRPYTTADDGPCALHALFPLSGTRVGAGRESYIK